MGSSASTIESNDDNLYMSEPDTCTDCMPQSCIQSTNSVVQSVHQLLHKMMFHPPPLNPQKVQLVQSNPNVQRKSLTTGSVTIEYLIYNPQKNVYPNKILIFSHGNAANIYNYYEYGLMLSNALGVRCVFYDYPGYGNSTGKLTSKACVDALSSVVSQIEQDYPRTQLVLVGQSIGTGVVCEHAHQTNTTYPLILISPYTSIVAVPGLTMSSCIERTRIDLFPSLTYVPNLTVPILIIHGTADEVINISHGKTLWNNVPNKLFQPLWLEEIGHNDILENIPIQSLKQVLDL